MEKRKSKIERGKKQRKFATPAPPILMICKVFRNEMPRAQSAFTQYFKNNSHVVKYNLRSLKDFFN